MIFRNRHQSQTYIVLLGLVALAVWLRWPALGTAGFHNEDVAGITLNADLILSGKLPLIDNLEYKAPGTFYLTALIWTLSERSMITLQCFGVGMACFALLGVFCLGRILYGRSCGLVAATLYAALSPITDSIDVNYGSWMIGPYIWATVCCLLAIKSGRLRWFFWTGLILAMAGVLKRQAAVLFPLFALAPLVSQRLSWPDDWVGVLEPKKAVSLFMVGLGVGFAPILLWYALHGEFLNFVGSYFFSESGWKYVRGQTSWSDRGLRLGDGFLGFAMYAATPSLLAILAIFRNVTPGALWTGRGLFISLHLVLSFLGAALGLRFFKGYYLQLLPILVIIAAHPNGVLLPWFRWSNWSRLGSSLRPLIVLIGSTLLVSPALIHDVDQVEEIRKRRQHARDPIAQKIGRYIRENSQPDQPIWVWGRWAWPVYFHANRPIATHFPKSLGVFTSTLTNTWRRPTKNTAFDPKSPWPILIKQLKAEKPKFLVLSHNESYRKFRALNGLLRSDYTAVKAFKTPGFSFYQRK